MNAIIEFFDAFGSLLLTWWHYFTNTIDSILWLITTLPVFVEWMVIPNAYIPAFLYGFCYISILLLVLIAVIRIIFK